MATLDDVITQKNKEIQKLLESIDNYKKEIGRLVQETTARRNELHNMSKMTVEAINGDIPILFQKKKYLEDEIATLQAKAIDNVRIAQEASKGAEDHYRSLEEALIKEYEKKHNHLKERESQISISKDNVDSIVETFHKEVEDHKQSLLKFNADKQSYSENVEQWNKTKEQNAKEMDNERAELHALLELTEDKKVKAKEIWDTSIKKEKEVFDKQKDVEAVLNRINEVKAILEETKKLEISIEKKLLEQQEELKRLKDISEEIDKRNVLLAQRTTRLDQRDARFHQKMRSILSLEEQKKWEEGEKNARSIA